MYDLSERDRLIMDACNYRRAQEIMHAGYQKSPLRGLQKDNAKYYKRIGEPGNYRYFYNKEDWDAYQKEISTKTPNPNSQELITVVNNMQQKRDNYKKNEEASKHEGDRWQKKEEPKKTPTPTTLTDEDRQELAEKARKHNQELKEKEYNERQSAYAKQIEEQKRKEEKEGKENLAKLREFRANTKETISRQADDVYDNIRKIHNGDIDKFDTDNEFAIMLDDMLRRIDEDYEGDLYSYVKPYLGIFKDDKHYDIVVKAINKLEDVLHDHVDHKTGYDDMNNEKYLRNLAYDLKKQRVHDMLEKEG